MKEDVIKRILETIKSKTLRDILIRKVQNDEDLSLEDTKKIYGPVEFGDELPMTKKRIIDIDWTDHAEYRGELRNINPDQMNETVKEKVKDRFLKKPKSKGKEKFKSETGTAVVDFDTSENPAQADVVTTWASDNGEINMLRFSSTDEAIQHLSDITGKRVKVAAVPFSRFKKMSGIKSPEDLKIESKDQDYSYQTGVWKGAYTSLYNEFINILETAQKMEEHLDEIYGKLSREDIERLDIDTFKG